MVRRTKEAERSWNYGIWARARARLTPTALDPYRPTARKRTANVTRWRDQGMAERWVASAWLETEKKFQRISGHQDLWHLAAILGREIAQRLSLKVGAS